MKKLKPLKMPIVRERSNRIPRHWRAPNSSWERVTACNHFGINLLKLSQFQQNFLAQISKVECWRTKIFGALGRAGNMWGNKAANTNIFLRVYFAALTKIYIKPEASWTGPPRSWTGPPRPWIALFVNGEPVHEPGGQFMNRHYSPTGQSSFSFWKTVRHRIQGKSSVQWRLIVASFSRRSYNGPYGSWRRLKCFSTGEAGTKRSRSGDAAAAETSSTRC